MTDSGYSRAWIIDSLTDVYPVPIRVGKHKRPQAVIFILKPLHDPGACLLTESKQRPDVIDQKMGHRKMCGPMLWLERKMQLAFPLPENNKRNGFAVLETLREA
jgi:hypothetical protein